MTGKGRSRAFNNLRRRRRSNGRYLRVADAAENPTEDDDEQSQGRDKDASITESSDWIPPASSHTQCRPCYRRIRVDGGQFVS